MSGFILNRLLKFLEKLNIDIFIPNISLKNRRFLTPDKNLPYVSIIVPNFGYDHYLESCLHSILSSSLRNIEVILVDSSNENHREDKLRLVLGKLYLDPRLRVFFRSAHKLGNNRNFGIEKAKAEYVCSIDPDDLIHPNYLLLTLFNLINRNLDVSGAGMHAFEKLNEQWYVKEKVSYLNLNIRNEIASNSIFRKSSWTKLSGFVDSDGKPHIHEDWRFWHRVSKSGGKIGNINYPLTMIRVHGKNMSWQPELLPPAAQACLIRRFNKDQSMSVMAILRCFFNVKKGSRHKSKNNKNVDELFLFISKSLGRNIEKLNSEVLDQLPSDRKVFLLEISDHETFNFVRNTGWTKVNMNQILQIDDWGRFIRFLDLYCDPESIFWTSIEIGNHIDQELV
jgi:glycosyltransferase involved in cell wall biosynthesis